MAGSNKASGGDQGTSGNNSNKTPSPPPASRPTPRRGGIPVPEGNRTPPPTTRSPTPRSMPLPWPRLHMGLPGVSAFTPYARTRLLMLPPPPQPQDEGSSTSQAITSTVVASGSRTPTSRKRRLDHEQGEAGAGDRVVRCSICYKEFGSGKALFGHMRSHPGRGWKGPHPPPAFNASEEFADLIPLFQQQQQPPVPADEPAAHEPEKEPEPKKEPEPELLALPAPPPGDDAVDGEKALEEEEDCGSSGGEGGRFIPDLNN